MKNQIYVAVSFLTIVVVIVVVCGGGKGEGDDESGYIIGLGSNPGPGVISWLSLLLVLVLAPRVFSGFSGFPPSAKTNVSRFQFDWELEGHGFVSRMTVICYPR